MKMSSRYIEFAGPTAQGVIDQLLFFVLVRYPLSPLRDVRLPLPAGSSPHPAPIGSRQRSPELWGPLRGPQGPLRDPPGTSQRLTKTPPLRLGGIISINYINQSIME